MQNGSETESSISQAEPAVMTKPQIILIGGGGHCRACIDVIELENRFQIAGIVERPEASPANHILGYPILGSDDDLPALAKIFPYALVTIGQIKSPEPRIRLYERLLELNFQIPVIISPLAYISKHAKIGQGTIAMHQTIVNAGANVGNNCILNTRALLEHDVCVGDNCHISTNSVLNGASRIGPGSFVGSSSIIREGVSVGKNCIIGAGTRVIKNIPENKAYIGQEKL